MEDFTPIHEFYFFRRDLLTSQNLSLPTFYNSPNWEILYGITIYNIIYYLILIKMLKYHFYLFYEIY